MAEIRPFHALRYDPSCVPLQDVVTQPYDKISPAMQSRYLALSPYNLVRVILGERKPDDSETAFADLSDEGIRADCMAGMIHCSSLSYRRRI